MKLLVWFWWALALALCPIKKFRQESVNADNFAKDYWCKMMESNKFTARVSVMAMSPMSIGTATISMLTGIILTMLTRSCVPVSSSANGLNVLSPFSLGI